MIRVLLLFITLAFIFPLVPSFGQDTQSSDPLEEAPILEQFNYTIEKSNRYEQFRVVRIAWLNKLKSNVSDTLKVLHRQIAGNQKQMNSHQQRIDSLNNQIGKLNTQLEKAVKEKNSFSFMGAQISKGGYQSFMWGLVVILATGLVVFILLFKRSNIVTAQTKTMYADLQKEFDDHRKRSLEREKVMARNHLNELNKLRGQ